MDIDQRHIAAATCLIKGMTREQAAIAGQVNIATIYNWQKEADFKELMRDLRRDMIRQTSGTLANSLKTYVLELEDIAMAPMDDPESPIKVQHKIQALTKLIDITLGTQQQTELTDHIEDLESELRKFKKTA